MVNRINKHHLQLPVGEKAASKVDTSPSQAEMISKKST